MKGIIYIASAFKTTKPKGCVVDNEVDNDPNIFNDPITWGICRPDLREKADNGDYVFFVLGADANLPQMIFAYIKIETIISHVDAYFRDSLKKKRMNNTKLNGNIIVDYYGDYNILDNEYHRHNFNRIKRRYAIADMEHSKLLNRKEIIDRAPHFVDFLSNLLNKKGKTPYQLISQYGNDNLSKIQINKILNFLNN